MARCLNSPRTSRHTPGVSFCIERIPSFGPSPLSVSLVFFLSARVHIGAHTEAELRACECTSTCIPARTFLQKDRLLHSLFLVIIRPLVTVWFRRIEYTKALDQKTLLMLFEKPSLRTRVSLETGMTQLGGHAIHYSLADSPLGKKESIQVRFCALISSFV